MSEMSPMLVDDLISDDYFDRVRSKFPQLDEEEFRTQLTEVLKYLYLTAQLGRQPFYPCNQLDLVWHELILQTQDYSLLCSRLPGGKFVHHASVMPSDGATPGHGSDASSREITFYAAYVMTFGGFKDSSIELWPRADVLRSCWNLAGAPDLNKRLKEILER